MEPKKISFNKKSENAILQDGLKNQISLPPIKEMAKGKQNVIIVVYDYSRNTPVHMILPVGRVICEKGAGILVSPGMDPETIRKLGFKWAGIPKNAFEIAFSKKGNKASIAVIKNGGEIMPKIHGCKHG
jgi:hypothetical protein